MEKKVEDLPEAVRKSPLIREGSRTTSVVFRVVDGKAIMTPVATGASNLTNIIITDGLKEGDVVVTGPYKALEKMKDGESVKKDEGGEWGSEGGGPGGGPRGGGMGGGRRGMGMRF